MSTQTIIALYDDKAAARQVLEDLRTAGYGDGFWLSSDSSHSSGGADRFSTLNSEFSMPTSRTTALTRLGIPAGRDEHLEYRYVDPAYAAWCTRNPLRRGQQAGRDYHWVDRQGTPLKRAP